MSKPAKAAAPATNDQPPKSKKKLIIVAAVVLLLAGAAAYYFLVMKPHANKKEEPHVEVAAEEPHANELPKLFDLVTSGSPLVSNLVSEDGDRYLQIEISLQVSSPEVEEKIKANVQLAMEAVTSVLIRKRPGDFNAEGVQKVKSELKAAINYALGYTKTAPVFDVPEETGDNTGRKSHDAEPDDREPKVGIMRVVIPHYFIQ